ncbi:MAG: hypothetical protein M1822_001513 [Bathelium mastoideum]|nr:MAG: hypothetical protein M1822_001513 [Bathelium mastoideum]
MATAEASHRPHDRHSRRRPFSSWVKKLTKKNSSDNAPTASKKGASSSPSKSKKYGSLKNNPYPESGYLHRQSIASSANGQFSMTPTSNARNSFTIEDGAGEERKPPLSSNRSAAPTVATNNGTIGSDTGQSKAGTSNTIGGGVSSNEGAGNSTFSSPNHSERSLTTTLTTIQSTAPSAMLGGPLAAGVNALPNTHPPHTPIVQFTHQFPPASPPPSAIPPHLTAPPPTHPTTYTTATANNLLTDNASILTLASSSRRHRRRHSLDTDASVRALAPSSVWGGSRESLPLSVLSANIDSSGHDGQQQPRSRPSVAIGGGGAGFASAERASVYSSSGIAPAGLGAGERNSYYAAGKQQSGAGYDGGSVRSGLGHVGGGAGGDGASMRSGLLGHGRNDSITGSIGGIQGGGVGVQTSPLASPREAGPGRVGLSRRSSDWKVEAEGTSEGEENGEHEVRTTTERAGAAVAGDDEHENTPGEKSGARAETEIAPEGVEGVHRGNKFSLSDDAEKTKENERPA